MDNNRKYEKSFDSNNIPLHPYLQTLINQSQQSITPNTHLINIPFQPPTQSYGHPSEQLNIINGTLPPFSNNFINSIPPYQPIIPYPSPSLHQMGQLNPLPQSFIINTPSQQPNHMIFNYSSYNNNNNNNSLINNNNNNIYSGNVVSLINNNHNDNSNNNNSTNNIDWSKYKNIKLPNILIIKILKFYIKSTNNFNSYSSLKQILSLVSKSWNLFIIPKLEIDSLFTRCDDYVKINNKLNNLIENFKYNGQRSGFISATSTKEFKNDKLGKFYSMLYQPSVQEYSTGYPYGQDQFNLKIGEYVFKNDILESDINTIINLAVLNNSNSNSINNKSQPLSLDSSKVEFPLSLSGLFDKNFFSNNCTAIFDKLLIYEEGKQYDTSHLNERENKNGKFQLGVILTQLINTNYIGGEIEIIKTPTFNDIYREDSSSDIPSNTQSIITNKFKLTGFEYISSYFKKTKGFRILQFPNYSVKKIHPITKGTNVVLKYNIYLNKPIQFYIRNGGNFEKLSLKLVEYLTHINNSHNCINNNNIYNTYINNIYHFNKFILDRMIKKIEMHLDSFNVGISLNSIYSNTTLKYGHEEPLKNKDQIIWYFIKEKFGPERIKVLTFLFKSQTLHITELNHANVLNGSIKFSESKHTLIFHPFDYNYETFYEENEYDEDRINVFSAIVILKNKSNNK